MQYKNLGKFIKEKRLDSGKSLNKFAIEFDIEPAILSRIENLRQDIKMGVLLKIASGFGMSPAEFLKSFEEES